MSYYVAPQQAENLFLRKSKNERVARYIAAQELACLVNDKSLGLRMPNGFSTKQLVEIKEENLMPKNKEEIFTAVETLVKLSDSKQKTQNLYKQSLEAHKSIGLLFEERLLVEDNFNEIKKSLKLIKDYAVALSAYKEALPEAAKAKKYLEEILELPE
ncbi:hypothetical protein [Leptolyngbya sp. FACHB-261]|uniref:hypothetical protein n=1 Tax=Leptolyngbya sp. FACHB-261 TaxID=2692806 RepID=UPI001688B80B|nr:hypothetical protein [Leptolyngbya sp. FACHB-261]MBD2104309.1 hypothetical protein [Leptolyngbya sp. FACHB-261]